MKKKILMYIAIGVLSLGLIGGATLVFATDVFAGDSEEQDQIIDPASVSVTQEQATQTALSQYPNATISSIELEDENGTIVYGIHLTADGTQYDVKVDANQNTVLSSNLDSDEGNETIESPETDAED